MDVASPTKYCIDLIYDFLCPVIMKENYKATLSHQEVVFFFNSFSSIDHVSVFNYLTLLSWCILTESNACRD